MRILIAVLAIGLAMGATDNEWPRQMQASEDVHMPTFRYKTQLQILTGMPKTSKIWSGFKARLTVKIQMITSTEARMQFESLDFMKRVNNRIDADPKLILPDEVFTEYTGPNGEVKLSSELEKAFEEPCSFTYDRGEIRDIKFSTKETVGSKNVKKAIMQMLQLNVNRRHENALDEQYKRAHPGSLFYTVMEDGVSGKCENLYSIQTLPHCDGLKSEHCNNVLNVTKVRNFNKCLKRPIFNMTSFNPAKCLNCSAEPQEESLIESHSTQRLNVTLPRIPKRMEKWDRLNKFLILSSEGEHDYVFQPFASDTGRVTTHIRTSMKLISRKAWRRSGRVEKSEEIKSVNNAELENLIMVNPVLDNLYLKKDLNKNDDIPTKKRIINEVLEKVLKSKLVPEEDTQTDSSSEESSNSRRSILEVSDHVLTLSRLLHECTENELVAIFEEYISKPKDDKKRLIVLDILPTIRTRPIEESKKFVERLLKAVISSEVSESRSQSILTSLSFSLLPTTTSIKLLEKVCTEKSLDFSVRRTACLAMGQKMFESCNTFKSRWINKSSRVCTPEIKQACYKILKSLVREAMEKREESKKEEEMLIALKTIGNSGIRKALPLLVTILENRLEYSEQIRTQALFALRRMINNQISGPRDLKLNRLVLPIFLNQREAPEVRVAAYNMLMALRPSLYEMELIARTIDRDESRQVASFVYSHLSSLSNSTFPCSQEMKRKVNRILKLVKKPLRFGLMYSKGMHTGYMNKDLMMGALVDAKLIYSPESPVPRAGNFKLKSYILGNTLSLFEVGFHAEGLSKILEKTLGPNGNWYGKPEQTSDSDETTAERNPDRKVRGHVYYKLFGTELNFNTFDEKTFTNMIRNQLLSNFVSKKLSVEGKKIDTERVSVSPKNVIIIPTEIGLPLMLNISHVSVAKVKGSAKIEFPENKLNKIEVKLDLVPSLHTLVRGSMSVMMTNGLLCTEAIPNALDTSGVMIDARLRVKVPLRITGKLDTKSKKIIDVEMELPKKERKLVEVDIVPKTFLAEYKPKSSEVFVSERIIYGKSICTPTKSEKEFDTKSLNLKFKVKTEMTSRRCVKDAPFHPMVGKQSLTIISVPTQKSKLSLSVSYDTVETSIDRTNIFDSVSKPSSSSSSWKDVGEEIVDFKPEDELTSEERYWINKYGKKTPKVKRVRSSSDESSSESSDSRESMEWERSHEDPSSVSSYEQELKYEGEDISSAELKRKFEQERLESPSNWNVKKYFNWWKQDSSRRVVSKKAREHTLTLKVKCDESKVVEAKLKYLSNPITSKLWLKIEHEPLMSEETNKNEIEVIYELRRPISTVELSKRISEDEQKIRTFVKVSWGKDLVNSPKIIRLRSTIEKSPEQIHKGDEILSMPEYEMCQRDRNNKRPYTPACLKVSEKEAELRQLTAVIEAENVPKWVKRSGKSIARMIQYYLYNELSEVEDVDIESPSLLRDIESSRKQKVLLKVRLTRDLDMVHLIMNTPLEKSRFLYVPLPMKVVAPCYRHPYTKQLMNVISEDNYPASCEVTGNLIKTFDNVVIKTSELESSECDLLVAKDCSRNNFFSVRLTKSEPTKREVKIRLSPTSSEETIIKLKTTSDDVVRIEVNGQEKDISEGEIEEIDSKNAKDMPKLVKIIRVSARKVIVKSPRLGVEIKYSGRDVRVLLSQLFRSKQCGVCGDFNGESTEEMKTPSLHIAKTPTDFIRSYAKSNNKCTSEPKHERLRFSYNPYEINRWDKDNLSELKRKGCGAPNRRNIVRQIITDSGELTTCVSVQKIKICEPHCSHTIQKTKPDVEFVCVDPSNPRPMEKIVEKVHRREDPEINSSLSSIKETMPVGEDTKCFY